MGLKQTHLEFLNVYVCALTCFDNLLTFTHVFIPLLQGSGKLYQPRVTGVEDWGHVVGMYQVHLLGAL